MSQVDALKLGFKKHSIIEFNCLNKNFRLNIRLSKNLGSKQIGLPIGRKGFPIDLVGKEVKYIREFIK